jgi:ribosome-associated translation inhibitor RaiA
MSSKYTSRIKAKPRKRKRRGGAMTEEGRDMYNAIRPVSKKAATYARKGVNTMTNHGEEMATIATAVAGGAMTEEGRDMYNAIRPVNKRAATYARKGVNTMTNHGEEMANIATAVAGGAMTEEGKDIYNAVRPVSKRAATYARKGVNTLMNHGEEMASIATAALGGDERAGGSLQNHHDKAKFIHRSFHNYHHAHHHVGNMSPYMHRGWRAVAKALSGGKSDPMFPHIKAHHFSDYKYSKHAKVPKEAYKDIAKSDRYSLMDALEDEHIDHKAGKSGAGLFHAVNSVAKASAHWGRK